MIYGIDAFTIAADGEPNLGYMDPLGQSPSVFLIRLSYLQYRLEYLRAIGIVLHIQRSVAYVQIRRTGLGPELNEL
jgi:hypothetical protein